MRSTLSNRLGLLRNPQGVEFPALLPQWENELGSNRAILSSAFTATLLVSASSAPLIGVLIDRGHSKEAHSYNTDDNSTKPPVPYHATKRQSSDVRVSGAVCQVRVRSRRHLEHIISDPWRDRAGTVCA
jgi:hypothetical protein